MNLETRLARELWEAVRTNYEKRNFTGSILDAFYFLSDLLRNKSGAEGDGAALIGQALGGSTPRIKLNRLQSESEWNVQKGMEQLLRGFYQSIRNPRSHEKVTDSEEDAQVVISFIGYLVRQIDQAKAQFSRQDFLERVFDPDFVPQKRYAELLVAEIPIGQRLEVFFDVFRAKEEWKIENMRHFFDALLLQLTEEERKHVKDAISQELRTADDETTIRLIIGSFSGDIWLGIDEVARLRIENRLVRSIREGRFERKKNRCRGGALGTWITRLLPYFSLKQDVLRAINDKLSSNSEEEEDYVFNYLFSHLKCLTDQMPPYFEYTFKRKLKAGDSRFHEALTFGNPWDNSTWNAEFTELYENFSAAESLNDDNPDDFPF